MDIKYVPTACYADDMPQKFYQYTVINEASKESFLYPYLEQTSFSTVDFLQRAIRYFGYQPQILQTDNGVEFTHIDKTDRTPSLDILYQKLGMDQPAYPTSEPRHNGKVERSHRSALERFYNHLKFYSFNDLNVQTARYRRRANQISRQSLDWLSPIKK